jgi:hypothetical protein
MSLRSLLLLSALLLAVFTTAQWSDVLYSWWFYVNVSKLCALDAPNVCVYFPRLGLNATDLNKTWIYIGDNVHQRMTVYHPDDFDLLQFVVRSRAPQSVTVYVPSSGFIFATSSFSVNGKTADQANICGRGGYAVYVRAGTHTVTNVPLPLYFVDSNCRFHRLGDYVNRVWNATALNRTVLNIFYMPTAREKKAVQPLSATYNIFNGTGHVYIVAMVWFGTQLAPVGRGFYIAGGTAVDATVYAETSDYQSIWYLYGPLAHDLWRNATFNTGGTGEFRFYSIGPTPGDGIVRIRLPDYRNATVVYLSDGTAGYMQITRRPPIQVVSNLKIYAERYALVEVVVETAQGRVYGARTLACPAYNPTPTTSRLPIVVTNMTRLDRAKEIEICNNNPYTVYVGLYVTSTTAPASYAHIDRINPNACVRLRWDGAISNTATRLDVFRNATAVCNGWVMLSIPGRNYTDGWRYYLVGNRLVPDSPIDLDTAYADMWRQIIQTLMQTYNSILDAWQQWLRQWLEMATNATAPSLQSVLTSRPQFLGTIKMDTATSVWLKTTLQELKKWRAVGVSPSYGAISLPQIPTAVAPAAAAAVAVAWAASRRDDDVATTAAIAGIALALFGILMTLVYGTESLTLVALGVIVAAAAAAWRRIS